MLKFFASLRSRAILLVFLAILPILALTLYSYYDQREIAIREVQRDELVAARNLATVQETLINSTRQLLADLAQDPQVQRRDRAACNLLFAEVLKQCPYYAAVAAADPQGRVFANAPAVQGPVKIADRLYFRKAIQTRAFCVGEPVLGRISNKYSINLALPILDDQGQVQGVLTASLDLHWLGSLLAKSDFPPGSAMGLTDATGKVLFRYPEPLKYIGKMLPEALIQALAAGNEGVAAGRDCPAIGASSPLPGWRLPGRSCGWPSVSPGNGRLARLIRTCGATSSGWGGDDVGLAAAWFGRQPVHGPAGQRNCAN